jgi:hypothetical protein
MHAIKVPIPNRIKNVNKIKLIYRIAVVINVIPIMCEGRPMARIIEFLSVAPNFRFLSGSCSS